MDIDNKTHEYYDFYNKINKLDFIKYEIELDSITHKVINIVFNEPSLEYINKNINSDEFIKFLILFFNAVLELKEKSKDGFLNKFLEENCIVCDICNNAYTLENTKKYNVYDIENKEFVTNIDLCSKCSNEIIANEYKDQNFLYEIIK